MGSFKAGAGTIQSALLPVPALGLGLEPGPGPEPALLVPGLDAASSQAIGYCARLKPTV